MEVLKAIGAYGFLTLVFMLVVGLSLAFARVSTDKTKRR